MKENKNISAPKAGMQREAHPSQLKNTDYTFMLNGNSESQVGESVNITNEPSNSLAVNFPVGYKVIHYKKDLLNNRTYYFLVNATEGTPNYKKSSIGYVDDTMIELYNQDPYVECEDCKKNHNRLEEISQAPSHTYVEIINDNCLLPGDGFNFDINYPIKYSELKQEKGVTNIYWNDKLNKPRWMCLSDVSYLQDAEVDCNGVLVEATCLKTYKLLQFPEHARLKIEPEAVQVGGTLKMGVYEFYAAYSNLYGDEATNYGTPTNPISIFDENNNILNDETTDSFTNYAIRLKVSNLDTRFPYYKVVCVETNNVNRTKSAFIVGIYPTTDNTILYTSSGSTNDDYVVTGNSSIKRRVDLYELSKVRPEYDFATGDVQSGGRKFMWGLKTKSEINLQPVVNLFGSLLKWQSNVAKENLYKTPIATAMYKGYMRNEVQPFAIRFLNKDGGYSANFPLIARPHVDNEKDEVDTTGDINYLSLTANTPICTTTDRKQRWQIYNTASQDTICDDYTAGGTPVEEDVEKKCTIDDAGFVPANSITLPIEEGYTYDGLADYIENNRDYILNPTSGEVYTNLGFFLTAANVPGNCTPTFPSTCPEPHNLVREIIGIDEIVGEVNILNPRALDDYQKSIPPSFCNTYSIDQTNTEPIPDTKFMETYMGCKDGALKTVLKRDVNTNNSSCTYAAPISNNNIPINPGVGYFHDYFGADSIAGLAGNYIGGIKSSPGNGVDFSDSIHKGAFFYILKKQGRPGVIFEVTKNSTGNSRDTLDDISDDNTPQKLRCTFYQKCNSTAPLKVPDGLGGFVENFIFNTSTGLFLELDIAGMEAYLLPTVVKLEEIYAVIDVPYVSESVPTLGDCTGASGITTKYRTAPPVGCYSVYSRDVQNLSVTSSWESIDRNKIQIYKASCSYTIPKVGDCAPRPYARGTFAFWESIEKYPPNKELYDSSNLIITPTDLQGLTNEDKELFKKYFVVSSGSEYTLKSNTDFTCDSPIRHFKFPDNSVSSFMTDITVAASSDALIFPIGIYLDPEIVSAMLQVAYNNNLITSEQLLDIEGYEILKGDNSVHKSVIASGLGYDMYKYNQKERDYYYANYPHNDLGKDPLHYHSEENKSIIDHPFGGIKNNKYSFLSPDLFLTRITIPTEVVLSGYQTGTSSLTFQDVDEHPKWTLLGKKAKKTAEYLALTETILDILVKTGDLLSQTWFMVGFADGMSMGAIGAAIALTGMTINSFVDYGKLRYEWLKIFDDLGTAYNFASYGVSHGYHNQFLKNESEANYLRAIPLRKYMRDGRYTYRDESSKEEIFVNNFQREHSVFLSTGDEAYSFNYSEDYISVDNNHEAENSSRTLLSLHGCASEAVIKGTVGSPYLTLKNYIPDQFGGIDSIKWLTTGYSEKIGRRDNCDIMILGGNVCISRFAWKRKIPMFKKNIVGTADKIPFNYGDYKNIGFPVYFCNYKSDSETEFLGIIPAPDIDSELNFDSCGSYKNGFYIKPPAKMYLFYYGIADFLVESEINCNFRYAQNSQKEFFYPQAGDVVDWTQEKNVPIKEPNRLFYNNSYSQQVSNTPYKVLDRGYSKKEWEKRTIQDNAVVYSEMDNSENDISDPWLTYKPLNWYEFPTKYGKLIQLKGVESESIIGRFENQLVKFNSLDKLQTTGGASIELGNAGIFAGRPVEYMTTDLGYSGTQHSDMVNTPYGNFFVDAKRGQVFQRAGDELVAISDRTGQQPSGLKNWFREQLPFKILKKFPETDIDNKYKGIGISMGWDAREERVFLTKKDYIPSDDPCLKYSEDIGFYTDCDTSELTCPDGYVYNEGTHLCEKMIVSAPLCPAGYVYDSVNQQCVLTTVEPADCACSVNVIATPSSQTINTGDSTSISLTSSTPGATFTWTVSQDGVTGASAGSGNTIVQTLVNSNPVSKTVVYTITPHFEDCVPTPINVIVTVTNLPPYTVSLRNQGYIASTGVTTFFNPLTPQQLKCYIINEWLAPPILNNTLNGASYYMYVAIPAVGEQLYNLGGDPSSANGTFLHRTNIDTLLSEVYTVSSGLITAIIPFASLSTC